jgi:heme O synthase-like polyprenyltransferase
MYAFGALGLGVFFLRSTWSFAALPTEARARKVLHASLIYLPAILALLVGERLIRYFLV